MGADDMDTGRLCQQNLAVQWPRHELQHPHDPPPAASCAAVCTRTLFWRFKRLSRGNRNQKQIPTILRLCTNIDFKNRLKTNIGCKKHQHNAWRYRKSFAALTDPDALASVRLVVEAMMTLRACTSMICASAPMASRTARSTPRAMTVGW